VIDVLTSRDQVIVTNHGTDTLNWRLDGRPYPVPAGATMHVPFDVVRINLGDPRSGEQARVAMDGNEKIRIASRKDELKRLDVLYGVGAKIMIASQKGEPTTTLQDEAPNVTVTDAEGNPIATVVDDPGGENPAPIPVNLDTTEAVAAQIAQMQKTMEGLIEKQKALDATQNPDGRPGVDDVTEDNPGGSQAA
jgi:hypothetical protein